MYIVWGTIHEIKWTSSMTSDAEYIHASDHNIRDMSVRVHANDQTSVICSYMHVTYRRGGYKRNPKMMLAPSRFRLAALVIFAIVDNNANSGEQQDYTDTTTTTTTTTTPTTITTTTAQCRLYSDRRSGCAS